VVCGIVQFIVPELVDVMLPIVTGFPKPPPASDNCAVNELPELNCPVAVYETVNADPAQIEDGENVVYVTAGPAR
jgi:hypothetical protein